MTNPTHPTEIDGYKVRYLAEGGMGCVYEARHPHLPTRVIKTIRTEGRTTLELQDLERRAGTEAWAASMAHPHIVQVHHKGTDAALGITYIVMDHVNGQDLKQALTPGQPLPFAQARDIVVQVLAALAFTHARGIVHRDVKPANVLVPRVGPIKLTDFGAARIMRKDGQPRSAEEQAEDTRFDTGVIGTDRYMAPEQAMGDEVTGSADLYATGVMLYELLTGRLPFAGKGRSLHHARLHETPAAPSSLNPLLPPGIDAVVLKALAADPADRHDSADDFAAALGRVGTADPGAVTSVGPAAGAGPTAGAAGPVGAEPTGTGSTAGAVAPRSGAGGKLAIWAVVGGVAVVLAYLAVRGQSGSDTPVPPTIEDPIRRTEAPPPPVPPPTDEQAYQACIQTLSQRVGNSPPAPPGDDPRRALNSAIGLATGPQSLLYAKVGADLALVSGALGLKLEPLTTNGTLHNITLMVSPVNAGLGLVQSDVLLYLPFSDDPNLHTMIDKLRLVLALYPEEVHVIVSPALAAEAAAKGFGVLKGKRITTARTSQGSRVTASNLLRLLAQDPKPDHRIDQDEFTALCSVAFGKADAMVVTTGAPSPLLKAVEALPTQVRSRLRLMPITRSPDEVYQPSTLSAGTYGWQPDAVPTLTLRSLLVSYDFRGLKSPYGDARCADLRRLGAVLRSQLPVLQANAQGLYHAKWKEVDTKARVPGWLDDPCATGSEVSRR